MPSRHAAHGQCMRSICCASLKGVGCVCSAYGPRMPPVRATRAGRVSGVDSPYVPHTCRIRATRLEHSVSICTTYACARPPPAWLSATPVKPPTPWARHTGEVGRETESMCGRFASTQTDAELLDVFRAVDVVGEQLPPSYNVAPTQPVRVVLEHPPRDAPADTPVRRIRTRRSPGWTGTTLPWCSPPCPTPTAPTSTPSICPTPRTVTVRWS